VGIVGFGGLGNMAAKLARALGAEVTIFTTRREKIEEGARIGAQRVVLEGDKKAFAELAGSLDFILSTIPEKHDLNPFTPLLKWNGVMVVVGALEPLEPVNNMFVAFQRLSLAGSLIGSIAETQAVLDFCAEHDIAPDIEMIGIEEINQAYEKVENGEVRFRYVIDMATLKDRN
jgi:uncharacterized zinc-type alcohol dehydrogenase-like protein